METVRIEYKGNLRTECTHLQSGQKIITDAPVDNHGKGEAFSPTDLMATSYGACMLTIVGIYCESNQISFEAATVTVEKIMKAEPRRIGKLVIHLDFSGNNWDESLRKRIEGAAKACPVSKSVHPDMEIELTFKY